jgi:hypothetical protein
VKNFGRRTLEKNFGEELGRGTLGEEMVKNFGEELGRRTLVGGLLLLYIYIGE